MSFWSQIENKHGEYCLLIKRLWGMIAEFHSGIGLSDMILKNYLKSLAYFSLLKKEIILLFS